MGKQLYSSKGYIKTTIGEIAGLLYGSAYEIKIVSEYDQEIPQSQTPDKPLYR